VRDLVARFPVRGGLLNRVTREVHAVEKVSFDLWPGETLSLVGESGCGKSTTGRALLRLVETQGGTITFDGQRIDTLSGSKLQSLRRNIQFIFRILTLRLTRVRRSVTRSWSRCGCMACCMVKPRVSGFPGC
jgi:glutathione transport system ATP-binding protein